MHELMKWSKYTQAPNCSEMTRYRCGASCLSLSASCWGWSHHTSTTRRWVESLKRSGALSWPWHSKWTHLAEPGCQTCDILWHPLTCADLCQVLCKADGPSGILQLAGILRRYGLHWPYHNLEAEHGATGYVFSDVLKETKVFGLEEFYSILVSPRFCDQKCSRQLQFVEIALDQKSAKITTADVLWFLRYQLLLFLRYIYNIYNHPPTPSLPATQLLPSQWKFAQFPGWWDTSTGRPRTRRATLCSTMCFRAKCRCRKTPQKWRGKWRESMGKWGWSGGTLG